MGISAAAEISGLLDWVAGRMLVSAGGSRRKLFVWTFLVGAMLTVPLSNDATAIVFTPVVYRAVVKRGVDALPYLYACTFVADTASFGFPFSNPANVLVLPAPDLWVFIIHLGPPMLAALAINLGIFMLVFRSQLRGSYPTDGAPMPMTPRVLRTLVAIIGVAVAYVVILLVHWPLGPVAFVGAAVALVVAQAAPRDAAARIGWGIFPLLAGLFVLVDAVERSGSIGVIVQAMQRLSHEGPLVATLAAAFGSAFAANLLNNLPVGVVSGAIVTHAANPTVAYPLIAGIDLGPNLTTSGSLATLLWLSTLRARGVEISPIEYLRLGLLVVPPMLLATALWLWIIR